MCEIGCGTGRVLLPIARAGLDCTGVDPSPAMLDVLRAKGPPAQLTLVEGSFGGFDTGRRYALVYAAFRVFQHLLTVEEQLEALANVRRHLAPGGRFAFDVFSPDLARMAPAEEPETEDSRWIEGDEEHIRYAAVSRDHVAQVMNVRFRVARRRDGQLLGEDVTELPLRWYWRFELEHLLARAGFVVEHLYGGFQGGPYDARRDMVFVVRGR